MIEKEVSESRVMPQLEWVEMGIPSHEASTVYEKYHTNIWGVFRYEFIFLFLLQWNALSSFSFLFLVK